MGERKEGDRAWSRRRCDMARRVTICDAIVVCIPNIVLDAESTAKRIAV